MQLSLQDPIFGSQVLIAQKQFLVHGPGNVGQDACPLHKFAPSAHRSAMGSPQMVADYIGDEATRQWITSRPSCSLHILTIRGRGFWLQASGRSPACFKVVSPPAQSLRFHQKSVLNVLWCWTLDIVKKLVQMTQHHPQHLAGWCRDHAGICTCGWDRLLVRALRICAERNLLCSTCGPN
jgi:hypothetical protein